MPQQWEYKFLLMSRNATFVAAMGTMGEWEVTEDGKGLGSMSMGTRVEALGAEGWELVAVTPRSSFAGYGDRHLAGVTSEELWVFKRAR